VAGGHFPTAATLSFRAAPQSSPQQQCQPPASAAAAGKPATARKRAAANASSPAPAASIKMVTGPRCPGCRPPRDLPYPVQHQPRENIFPCTRKSCLPVSRQRAQHTRCSTRRLPRPARLRRAPSTDRARAVQASASMATLSPASSASCTWPSSESARPSDHHVEAPHMFAPQIQQRRRLSPATRAHSSSSTRRSDAGKRIALMLCRLRH